MARKTVEELAIAISMESDGFKKEMTSINGLIRKTEKEFKAAGKGVDNYEKTFVGLDSKIQKTSKQIELYNKKLTAQQNEHKKTSKALEDNKKKLDESEKELKKIEETQGKNSKAWEKQSKIVEKNSDLVHKNAQKIIGLSGDIKTTEGNINKLNRELEESQKEFDNLGKKTQTLDDKLENITTQSNLTQSEFNKLGSELQKNGGYFQKLGNEMNKLSSEISSGVNKINAYENEIDKLDSVLGENKTKHSQLKKEINDVQKELSEAKNKYGENSTEANQLNQKLLRLKDSYNQVETEIEQNNRELTQYRTQLNNVEAEVNELSNELLRMPFDQVSESLKSTGSSIKSVGQGLTAGVTVPIGAAGAAATKAGVDFDSAMSKLQATSGITDKTSKSFVSLENKAREMGSTTSFSATDAANGLTYLALAGWDVETQIDRIEPVLRAAEAGGMDLARCADLVTDSMQAAGIASEDFSKYLDITAQAQRKSNTSMEQMLEAYTVAGGMFDQLNMPLEKSGALLGVLANRGTKGSEAGHALISVFSNLITETGQAGDALEAMDISLYDSAGKQRDMVEVLKEMATKLGVTSDGTSNLTDQQKQQYAAMVGGKTQFDTLMKLLSGVSGEYDTLEGHLKNSNGALSEMAKTMKDNLGGAIDNMKSSIEGALIEGFKAMEPILENVVKWITDAAKWFSNLDDSTQQTIITIGAMAAAVGPLLMGIGQLIIVGGNAVTLFGKLKGSMAGNAAASTGLTSALGFLASPVGIGAAIVAIGGLIAMIGDNENAILKLQEKFGGFGTVIGGVCEFVSGHVQLTFGNLAIAIMGVFDIIGAIIDGPGGATVDDAVKGMTAKMNLNTEEAMGKIVLTTTRGMSQMRNATDEQLNGTVTSMNTIMDAIPRIVDGKYRTASQALGQQLHNMDFTQLSILQGMNDTTKMMFQGIVEGMSVEQASKKVEQNLKEMAAAGKIDADTMQKDISQAMEQMKQQMDTKTKEGADKVNTNTKTTETQAVQNAKNTNDGVTKEFKDMSSNVDKSTKESGNKSKANMDNWAKDAGNATNNMANEAKKGTGKLVTNTDTDMKNANKAVQQSATDMYNGSKKSYSKMADVARIEGTRMYNGVSTSAEKMAQKAKSSASDMYRGVTTSTRLMANAAISDWNRIRNAYSRPISGTVTKTTINRSFSEGVGKITKELPNISGSYTIPREANLKLSNSYLANFAMPRIDTSKYVTRGSYYNSNSYNSSFSSESRSTSTKKLEDKLDILINLMSDLLYKKEESPNKSNFVELRLSNNAGRRIAELIAPFGEVIEDYKTERDPRFV